jgi:membrane protein implicated in regulation of membrane protease activity
MEVSNEILWLVAGVFMVIAEFALIPGLGLLFAGISAVLVGALLGLGVDLSQSEQIIVFLGGTVILTATLYKKFKNLRTGKSKEYSDMIGSKATVLNDLAPGQTGSAKWSGTIMKARLCSSCTDKALIGTEAEIIAVDGNVLILQIK